MVGRAPRDVGPAGPCGEGALAAADGAPRAVCRVNPSFGGGEEKTEPYQPGRIDMKYIVSVLFLMNTGRY